YKIAALLTNVTSGYDRISMHGVRRSLLERQVQSIGLPLEKVLLPKKSSNAEYESKMRKALEKYSKLGVSKVFFGDIFLTDARKYRENQLAKVGMTAGFPLWKRNTKKLANEFIKQGFKAVITCVDSKVLGKEFAGREFNCQLLSELPANVDPCGENGEFHSFVYDGSIFKKLISYKKGRIVLREKRFYYCDLMAK
ncbi:MAG: ATP-binding protein, partial [Candidatus Diapherotrites archaeon]|nr:ATP-binding protein [Candidatus Diapherotrites archaeon]